MLALLLFGQNITKDEIGKTRLAPDAWVATYWTGSVHFSAPTTLTPFAVLKSGRMIHFTSFDGQYHHGGIIPEGGMEVFAQFWGDAIGESAEKAIADEAKFSRIISRSKIDLLGQASTQVVYETDYFGLFQQVTTVVYFERDSKIYMFTMVVRKEDTTRKELTGIFEKLLQSVRFVN